MKPILQEKIYVHLYRTWQMERKQAPLMKIANKDCFVEDVQKLILALQNLITKKTTALLISVYEKTIKNIEYMVSDLFEMRQDKILQTTKNLQKLDENRLLSLEKAFYRQCYSAFKGYSKSKKSLVTESSNLPKDIVVEPTDLPRESSKKPAIPNPISLPSSNVPKKPTNIDRSMVDSLSNSSDAPKIIPSGATPSSNQHIHSSPLKESPSSINYIALRIIHEINSLVGEDMKIYGPFVLGNFVYLPETNGKILIEENFAVPLSG